MSKRRKGKYGRRKDKFGDMGRQAALERNPMPTAKPSQGQQLFAEAMLDQSENRRAHLKAAAHELRQEMERQALVVMDLILAQPPIQLLGYLIGQFHIGLFSTAEVDAALSRARQKEVIQIFQLALEYAHAVWATHPQLRDEASELHEENAIRLLAALDDLQRTTMFYCMVSTGEGSSSTEFHAKSSWSFIRGNRYQVLEEEFFRFALTPHDGALHAAYGMEAAAIAAGLQATADSFRTGLSRAAETIEEGTRRTHALVNETMDEETALRRLSESDPEFVAKTNAAINDLFFGGVCNLSQHTNLTTALLEDLCYTPGENTEFLSDGEFKGTPMRTLPARIKPGIKLGKHYYAPDGQFIRDSAYRAIQRGLIRRLPEYRHEWARRQKDLTEGAYPAILDRQLAGARIYSEVFYESATGQWAETDLVMVLADVLFVIEVKAGSMPMHSPATNFDRHERVIRDLIIRSYQQCERFLGYLASAPIVPIYQRRGEEFAQVSRLSLRDYRIVLPIGLTVEPFTPFSAMSKEFSEIKPILGQHPFISMSIDDVFVLKRFLPTTGELLHYLQVRQQVAGIPNAMLFDEIDHLGAYIRKNRFDVDIRDQLKKADRVTWDSFSDLVDEHFEGDDWQQRQPPHQLFPAPIGEILSALDVRRPPGWLGIDARIRDIGSDGRTDIAERLSEFVSSLKEVPARRFQFGDDRFIVWLCRSGTEPSPNEIQRHGQITCLAANVQRVLILRVSYDPNGSISDLNCATISSPTVLHADYAELVVEAERQRRRQHLGSDIGGL